MNFKETFLSLTEYTIPFGYEADIEYLLPKGWTKDSIGNYYYTIGKSETLFTSHLDTSCVDKVKVKHVIEGDIIKTDGSTILGGDNKAGCTVLFYLIEKRIPGTYYFFIGEEMSVHKNYPYGSLLAIEEKPDFFNKFKRIISFDRKEKGQLITRQLGRNCCSPEFAEALIDEFSKYGIKYEKDTTGYYTDSAFFGSLIPEIVNLSIGVWNEHTNNEYVDIKYVENVAKASSKVNWESLPTINEVDSKYEVDSRKDSNNKNESTDASLFGDVFTILDDLYYVCHEFRSYQNYLSNFKSGRKYHFTKWHEDDNIEISISEGVITANGNICNTIDEFKSYIGITKLNITELSDFMLNSFIENGMKLTDAKFNYLLYLKTGDISTLKTGLSHKGYTLNQIGKGYEIIKESVIKNYKRFRWNSNI